MTHFQKKNHKTNRRAMMNSVKNRVQLIGNLGAAPEMLTAENGRKRAKMRLATNERYTNAQGQVVEETYWHTVIAWGPLAEVAERLTDKGTELLVEGKLTYHEYNDKDGNPRRVTEIVVQNLLILDRKKEAASVN